MARQAHHLIIICETFVTMISGFPRYRVIFPDTVTVLPSYCCGFENCPALAEGIQAVKAFRVTMDHSAERVDHGLALPSCGALAGGCLGSGVIDTGGGASVENYCIRELCEWITTIRGIDRPRCSKRKGQVSSRYA